MWLQISLHIRKTVDQDPLTRSTLIILLHLLYHDKIKIYKAKTMHSNIACVYCIDLLEKHIIVLYGAIKCSGSDSPPTTN